MKKVGTLQLKPVVRRVIYLSRDANKALNEIVKIHPYTPGEYVELLILEEAEKMRSAAKEIIRKQKKRRH